MITGFNNSDNRLLFWFLDVFQLGSIFILLFEYIPFGYDGVLTTKLFARVLPLLISETILFFGVGIIQKDNIVEDYVIILTYINFMIFLLLAVILLTIFDHKQWKTLKSNFIYVFATYLSQTSLLSIKDPFGVKIGYYCYAFGVISLLFIVLLLPKLERKNHELFNIVFSGFNQLPLERLFQDQGSEITKKYSLLQYHLNQYIRIVLLLVFGYHLLDFNQNFTSNSLSDQIQIINYILSLSLGAIYLIFSFKKILNLLFCIKAIKIRSISYLKRIVKSTSTFKKGMLKKLLIFMHFQGENFQSHLYRPLLNGIDNQNQDLDNCNKELCSLYPQFFSKMSNIESQGVELVYYQVPKVCQKHYLEILIKVKHVPRIILDQFDRYHIDFLTAKNIYLRRYSHGNISDLSLSIDKILLAKIQLIQNTKDFLNLQSQTLQVYGFLKLASFYMPVLPSQVLYDLYD